MPDIIMDYEIVGRVVGYARKIAEYRHYPKLENGLQPVDDYEVDGVPYPGLETKLFREWKEFLEAVRTKGREQQRHEAADIYYYCVCIETQTRDQSLLPEPLKSLLVYGFTSEEIEVAADAKYGWRSEQPGNKDEAHELELIEAAWEKRQAENATIEQRWNEKYEKYGRAQA